MSDNPLTRLREAKSVDEALEEVVAARRAGADAKELFGGPRDWVDSMAPAAAFLLAYLLVDLRTAIYAALGVEAVVIAVRLVQRETLRHAFSGAFGVVIAAAIAAKTHKAKNYFLPGIVINGVYAAVFLFSVAFGRPLVGVIMRLLSDKPREWHDHPRVKRAYVEVTLIWTAMFLLRVVVQAALWRADKVGWLGVTRFALGYPLYVGALAMTVPYVKRRTRDVPVPEPVEGSAEEPPEPEPDAAGEHAGAEAP